MQDPPQEIADYRYMNRILHKNNMQVTSETVGIAMRAFKSIVPTKTSLDINQFDIVMSTIGLHCPIDRQRLFRAFDFDMNNTVEYTEFIWGIAMLLDGSNAQKFDKIWKEIDEDGGGSLTRTEVQEMLAKGGAVTDELVSCGIHGPL